MLLLDTSSRCQSTATVSNSPFQETSKVSSSPFQVYKSCFPSSILFKDFLQVPQGWWCSSTARCYGHLKLRISPWANNTAWTIIDPLRPTITTPLVTSDLTNRDTDHLASTTQLILQQSPDTWPHSYINDLHWASRLVPDPLDLLSPRTISWVYTFDSNTDIRHLRDYMDYIQPQRFCALTNSSCIIHLIKT